MSFTNRRNNRVLWQPLGIYPLRPVFRRVCLQPTCSKCGFIVFARCKYGLLPIVLVTVSYSSYLCLCNLAEGRHYFLFALRMQDKGGSPGWVLRMALLLSALQTACNPSGKFSNSYFSKSFHHQRSQTTALLPKSKEQVRKYEWFFQKFLRLFLQPGINGVQV